MTETKLICRLLDPDGRMFGWTEIQAKVRGDGCLRAPSQGVVIYTDEPGYPAYVSIHWCDINIEIRLPITDSTFFNSDGQSHLIAAHTSVSLYNSGDILIHCGETPSNLPPIVIKSSIKVEVPVGMLVSEGHKI